MLSAIDNILGFADKRDLHVSVSVNILIESMDVVSVK